MTTYALSPYTIRILDPGGNTLRVDDFLNHCDLLTVLENYLRGLKRNLYQNYQEEFVLRTRTLDVDQRCLSGKLEKGEYGFRSVFLNTVSQEVSFKRGKDDAELLPFYFLIGVPKKGRGMGARVPMEAIAIFQTADGDGIQEDFEKNFALYFGENFAPLHIAFERLIPRQFAEQLLKKGRVTQLRFVKYGVQKNLENQVKLGPVEGEGILEFRVKAKRGKALDLMDRFDQVLKGGRAVKDLLEVQDFNYDDVKVQLESEGRYHTLNIGRLESIRAPYEFDITKKLGSPGHNPDYDQIHVLASEYLVSLAEDLDLKI